MIPKSCKRLAEVDFPIAVVSRHSVREKSSRRSHPNALHLWWARKPLATCRAILLASLLPDPCDESCPGDFINEARVLLATVQGEPGPHDADLQKAMLRFIGDFSSWDLAANPRYLEVGRGLIKAAHADQTPLVVDPFAGGGSIPLEALRLGCDAFASDLNPVACLILKILLEDIPRHGQELGEELRRAAGVIKQAVESELAEYYPSDTDGGIPTAYLWARTVRCESPDCGAEIPLVSSFWLCKKPGRLLALRYKVVERRGSAPGIDLEVFTPTNEADVHPSTVVRAKATCLVCARVLASDRLRSQLRSQRGGADVQFDASGKRVGGARLVAVVKAKEDAGRRQYRIPTDRDYEPVWKATRTVAELVKLKLPGGLSPIPDEPISLNEVRRVSVPLYGAEQWGDLWTSRQKMMLAAYLRAARVLNVSPAAKALLALAIDRLAMQSSAHCRWKASGESLMDMFARHAIGMEWYFAEASPTDAATDIVYRWMMQFASLIDALSGLHLPIGGVLQADACEHPLPEESADMWFTDPPYYDSIPYSHLADCFYVWLKRVGLDRGRYGFLSDFLSPKETECVVDRPHRLSTSSKDADFFESHIALAAKRGRRILRASGIGCIVFAHQSTEGWESLLSGIIGAGWCITASWPVATELASRLNARDTASLATSIHLICRPRSEDATVGDWGDVLRELPDRIGGWMERLSAEGVRGADLVFACIGPAMEVYSRHSKVEDAEGREIPLGGNPEASEPHKRGFLAYVWETVGRTALGQVLGTAEARARNGAAGALEEDARLTALFLWTLQSTALETDSANGSENDQDPDDEDDGTTGKKKGLSLIYDVVRRFSQPLGIHLENWNDRIISTEKGIVRLLPVTERAEHLLGEDGATGVADVIERNRGGPINYQFAFAKDATKKIAPATDGKGRKRRTSKSSDEAPTMQPGTTTLDRVHIAMLLQSAGKSNALRTMLKAETDRGPDFLRLANALSALYPKDSDEKRLLDAMLLAMPK